MSDENEGGDVIHLPPRSDPDDVLTLPGRTYTGTAESPLESPAETTLELPVIFPERTAAQDLAEIRPAGPIPPPPDIPQTFRSEGVEEQREARPPATPSGGPALAAAAVMAAALAALRGMAGWLSDRRARQQTEAEQAAPLREARQKARLAQEEAAADHALAMRKMKDKGAQQRASSRVPSGQEWGQKSSGRGSGGGKGGSGVTGPKSSGKGSSGAHGGSGKSGAAGAGNDSKGGRKGGAGGGSAGSGAGAKGSGGKNPGATGSRSKGSGAGGPNGGNRPKGSGGRAASGDGRREKHSPSKAKDRPKKSPGGAGESGRTGGMKPGAGSGRGSGGGDKPPRKSSGAGALLNKTKTDRNRKRRKNSKTAPTGLNGKQDNGKTRGGKDRREKPKAPRFGASGTSPWREAFRTATTGGRSGKAKRTTGSHRSRARTAQGPRPRRPWEDPDRRERSKTRSSRKEQQRRQRQGTKSDRQQQRREEARTWRAGAGESGAFGERSAWEDARGATGPVSAAEAGITVERVRPDKNTRKKPQRAAAIGSAPRALPRAPENGTRRPGTQKPAPKNPPEKGPRMNGTSQGLSAHHATEMNLDEYLVAMTNIATTAVIDKEGARTIAQTMMRLAKALDVISQDIADAHNIGREVVSQIDALTEDSEGMQRKALEMTKRFSTAADRAYTVAVEVGGDYRQDKDAKDDAGLTHASAAAHHA